MSPKRLLRYNGRLLVAVMVTAILSLGAAGVFAVVENRRDTDRELDRAAEAREQRAQDTAAADLRICREVNKLKAAQRDEAGDSYRNLERNLRLLSIEFTPEIRQIAREQYETTLKRFQDTRCGSLPSQEIP